MPATSHLGQNSRRASTFFANDLKLKLYSYTPVKRGAFYGALLAFFLSDDAFSAHAFRIFQCKHFVQAALYHDKKGLPS